jgi:hypothetical protein
VSWIGLPKPVFDATSAIERSPSAFETLRNGGFRLAVNPDVLLRNQDDEPNRRPRLTVV